MQAWCFAEALANWPYQGFPGDAFAPGREPRRRAAGRGAEADGEGDAWCGWKLTRRLASRLPRSTARRLKRRPAAS